MIGIQLGERSTVRADDDVAGRLLDCHRRARFFLREALALAERRGDPARRMQSAAAIARYFEVAFPLHEADEDASIAPRLRGLGHEPAGRPERAERGITPGEEPGSGSASVWESLQPDAAMMMVLEEHGDIDRLIARLLVDWKRWAAHDDAHVEFELHRRMLRTFVFYVSRHLDHEERDVFPLLARLPASERRDIVIEMNERRR